MAGSLVNLPLPTSEDLARLPTEPIVAESLVNLRTHESLVNLPLNASEDLACLPTESIVTEPLVNLPLNAAET